MPLIAFELITDFPILDFYRSINPYFILIRSSFSIMGWDMTSRKKTVAAAWMILNQKPEI